LIDNASTDNIVKILREIISKDRKVKAIVNTRNFGHIRSHYWGVLQSNGDATIYLASDFDVFNQFNDGVSRLQPSYFSDTNVITDLNINLASII
jgi:glycosyltransferase involved in cell wall biosynthesis